MPGQRMSSPGQQNVTQMTGQVQPLANPMDVLGTSGGFKTTGSPKGAQANVMAGGGMLGGPMPGFAPGSRSPGSAGMAPGAPVANGGTAGGGTGSVTLTNTKSPMAQSAQALKSDPFADLMK